MKSFKQNSDSFFSSVKRKTSPKQAAEQMNVWYCQYTSVDATLLPPAPKGIIKSVSVGRNQIVGLTGSGLLISWQSSSPQISVSVFYVLYAVILEIY